jgi:hypothetical protein
MKISKIQLVVAGVVLLLIITGVSIYQWFQQEKFEAPRQGTPDISFTIGESFTLQAVVSDLKYYNFIKDEEAFKYALEHTKDTTPGNENSLKIGDNTIEREARYTINQSMAAWQIADILLNQGEHSDCDHGCPESNFTPELLPGGNLAPTIEERYSWVKTYEDCVKAVGTGHDGGQLTSEQNHIQTGRPRGCTSPDGRYFTQGQEGWSETSGG